uniref:Uncharacterized protein n=1 Tax=Steinernema glaseri TaxID=37863 RepID=A0A1I7ZDD4_9BILA
MRACGSGQCGKVGGQLNSGSGPGLANNEFQELVSWFIYVGLCNIPPTSSPNYLLTFVETNANLQEIETVVNGTKHGCRFSDLVLVQRAETRLKPLMQDNDGNGCMSETESTCSPVFGLFISRRYLQAIIKEQRESWSESGKEIDVAKMRQNRGIAQDKTRQAKQQK